MGAWSSCSESLDTSLWSLSAAHANIVPVPVVDQLTDWFVETLVYEGWNFNSGNYLFTTDTK